MISTSDLRRLPSIPSFRRLTRALAMLDAILSPDWEGRYYSFNSRWADGVLLDVTAAEVGSAPEGVRDLHQEILSLAGSVLAVTADVLGLVAKYEAGQILAARYRPTCNTSRLPRWPASMHS